MANRCMPPTCYPYFSADRAMKMLATQEIVSKLPQILVSPKPYTAVPASHPNRVYRIHSTSSRSPKTSPPTRKKKYTFRHSIAGTTAPQKTFGNKSRAERISQKERRKHKVNRIFHKTYTNYTKCTNI